MFNWWADLLRAKDSIARTSGAPYIHWIKSSIARNKPYNQMVHELLTASGGGWEKDNGAVGYYVRDQGMPLDNMANTVRIFLGTRLECAQCHNHPFDDWKQSEFYEMAAFTHGLKPQNYQVANNLFNKDRKEDDLPRELRDMTRMVRYAVYDFSIAPTGGEGKIALPPDYKYRDGKPGEWIDASTTTDMGKKVRVAGTRRNSDDSRIKFADWATSPDNKRFTKVIANRMWKRVMGRGLFEPVDNLSAASEPSNPALMNYLEELMKTLNYDLQTYQRIIASTYTFQLGPNPQQHPAKTAYHFNGRQLQRLTAEQIWDSVLALTVPDVDSRKNNGYSQAIYWKGKPVLVGQKTMEDSTGRSWPSRAAPSSSTTARTCSPRSRRRRRRSEGQEQGHDDDDQHAKLQRQGPRLRTPQPHSGRPLPATVRPVRPRNHPGRQHRVRRHPGTHRPQRKSPERTRLQPQRGRLQEPRQGQDRRRQGQGALPHGTQPPPDEDELVYLVDQVKADGEKAYANILSALVASNEFIFLQ